MQDRDAERRRAGRRPHCHFFNSFFVNKLYMDERSYSYDAVQRCTLPEKLMQNDQVRTRVSQAWTEQTGAGFACSPAQQRLPLAISVTPLVQWFEFSAIWLMLQQICPNLVLAV